VAAPPRAALLRPARKQPTTLVLVAIGDIVVFLVSANWI
jgi:hypothetical protein